MKNWILLSLLTVAGCQLVQNTQITSPGHVQPGDRLVLERSLPVPASGEMLYLQQGEPISVRDVQSVEPHCVLRTRRIFEYTTQVQPDTFSVTTVRYSQDEFGYLPGQVLARNDHSAPSQWFYKVDLGLDSPLQPNVLKLTCQVDRMHASGLAPETLVTRGEVETALRGLMRLEAAIR